VRELIRAHWMPALAKFRPAVFVISFSFCAQQRDLPGLLRLPDVDHSWITERLQDAVNKHAQSRGVNCMEHAYSVCVRMSGSWLGSEMSGAQRSAGPVRPISLRSATRLAWLRACAAGSAPDLAKPAE
jgi:acetoin utilization deacetylase AcuC-like enzyme